MAVIEKYGTPSLSSPTPSRENSVTGLHAGEDIEAGDVCLIDSTGAIMRADDNTGWRAIAAGDAPAGEPLTLYVGVNFHYGQALTPGTALFATTDGALDDTDPADGSTPVAVVLDSTRVRFFGRG